MIQPHTFFTKSMTEKNSVEKPHKPAHKASGSEDEGSPNNGLLFGQLYLLKNMFFTTYSCKWVDRTGNGWYSTNENPSKVIGIETVGNTTPAESQNCLKEWQFYIYGILEIKKVMS